MGVESGRIALAAAPEGYAARPVAFATTAPAYADKTNATAIHAALGLPDDVPAFDAVGAIRSGVGAAWMAQAAGGLAVLADVRTGRPGSADEAGGGDAAVTLAFGERRRHRRGRRRRVGQRRVHRSLAGARRGVLPAVGGALR